METADNPRAFRTKKDPITNGGDDNGGGVSDKSPYFTLNTGHDGDNRGQQGGPCQQQGKGKQKYTAQHS